MRKIKYKQVSEDLKTMAKPSEEYNSSRSSVGMEKDIGEYFYISIDKLVPFHSQARTKFNEKELNELSSSIQKYGIRQPLTILPFEEDHKYEIISGERRYRAAKIAGLTQIPCIIMQKKEQAEEIALIENLHREDLHPVEFGLACYSLLERGVYGNQQQLAENLSFTKSAISEHLKYAKLPKDIRDYLISNDIHSRDILRKLVKKNDDKEAQEKILSINQPQKEKKSNGSVLRITLKDDEFKVQDKPISNLSDEKKEELKHELQNLINKL